MYIRVIDGTEGAFLNTDRRWKRHTARICSDGTGGRAGGKERRRAVIRYLGVERKDVYVNNSPTMDSPFRDHQLL